MEISEATWTPKLGHKGGSRPSLHPNSLYSFPHPRRWPCRGFCPSGRHRARGVHTPNGYEHGRERFPRRLPAQASPPRSPSRPALRAPGRGDRHGRPGGRPSHRRGWSRGRDWLRYAFATIDADRREVREVALAIPVSRTERSGLPEPPEPHRRPPRRTSGLRENPHPAPGDPAQPAVRYRPGPARRERAVGRRRPACHRLGDRGRACLHAAAPEPRRRAAPGAAPTPRVRARSARRGRIGTHQHPRPGLAQPWQARGRSGRLVRRQPSTAPNSAACVAPATSLRPIRP